MQPLFEDHSQKSNGKCWGVLMSWRRELRIMALIQWCANRNFHLALKYGRVEHSHYISIITI